MFSFFANFTVSAILCLFVQKFVNVRTTGFCALPASKYVSAFKFYNMSTQKCH